MFQNDSSAELKDQAYCFVGQQFLHWEAQSRRRIPNAPGKIRHAIEVLTLIDGLRQALRRHIETCEQCKAADDEKAKRHHIGICELAWAERQGAARPPY